MESHHFHLALVTIMTSAELDELKSLWLTTQRMAQRIFGSIDPERRSNQNEDVRIIDPVVNPWTEVETHYIFTDVESAAKALVDVKTWSRSRKHNGIGGVTASIDYVCRCGGHAKRNTARREKKQLAMTSTIIPRGFTRDHARNCSAELKVAFNKQTKTTVVRSRGFHNHEKDYVPVSYVLHTLDTSGALTPLIRRIALGNPNLTAQQVLKACHESINSSEHPAPTKAELLTITGILRDKYSAEFARILSRIRGENRALTVADIMEAVREDRSRKESMAGNLLDEAERHLEEHNPWVLGVNQVSTNPACSRFAMTISTDAWLQRAHRGHNGILCIDATYKAITNGFKVVVIGTENVYRSFRPIALGIVAEESSTEIGWVIDQVRGAIALISPLYDISDTWNPPVYMADGSDAITLALSNRFPDAFRLNCYFHFTQSLDRRLSNIEDASRHLIKREISIIAAARDRPQFEHWVGIFMTRWQERHPDLMAYLRKEYMSPDKWQSHWYWGTGGYTYLKNSRCNNGVECFNKQIHAEWLSYRQAPMRRILNVLLATTLSVDSWRGSLLEDRIDPYHPKFNPIWRLGSAFIEGEEFMRRVPLGNDHWAPMNPDPTGSLYAFGVESPEQARVLFSGVYDPFSAPFKGSSLTYVSCCPTEAAHKSACTCAGYVQESLCKHIIACLIEKGLVSIPILILNRPTASHGLRKPRVRTLGRNGCLRRFSDGRTQRGNAGRDVASPPEVPTVHNEEEVDEDEEGGRRVEEEVRRRIEEATFAGESSPAVPIVQIEEDEGDGGSIPEPNATGSRGSRRLRRLPRRYRDNA